MALKISGNLGFITNSSSAIFHFPRVLLEDPRIDYFLKAYQLQDGYVGSNLWHRDLCETLAVTQEQKKAALAQLRDPDVRPPHIDLQSDSVLLIYGDEYLSVTSYLGHLVDLVAKEKNLSYDRDEYN